MENKARSLTDGTKFAVPISRAFHHLKSSLFSDPKSRPLNPNPKPLHSTSSANRNGAHSSLSISDTSIGSSNFNDVCSDYRSCARLSTPPRAPLTDIGNRSDGVYGSAYGPKQVQDKAKDKGKEICLHLPINSSEKKRRRRTPSALPTEKRSDVGKGDSRSIGCNSSVNTRNKKKETVKPTSCPPIPKIRNKRVASREAGDIGVSHSYTAPNLQGNKKKSRLSVEDDDSVFELPREFVEQQKAYFQEIDDFKLVEEVASESESDTEVHVGKT